MMFKRGAGFAKGELCPSIIMHFGPRPRKALVPAATPPSDCCYHAGRLVEIGIGEDDTEPVPPFPTFPVQGWFDLSCVEELSSMRQVSQEAKAKGMV